uniref:Uncharacterized protein n=1 Tax=Rhipicephalus zambeziensis TaxID=60191 RepID=A0A224YGZ7_9ACAR
MSVCLLVGPTMLFVRRGDPAFREHGWGYEQDRFTSSEASGWCDSVWPGLSGLLKFYPAAFKNLFKQHQHSYSRTDYTNSAFFSRFPTFFIVSTTLKAAFTWHTALGAA